jgi:dTDP-glucose 4,6-dehydratase
MSRDTILITGSFGFIGSNFVRTVVSSHKGYDQVSFDKIVSDINLTATYYNKNHTYHFADVNDAHIMGVLQKKYQPKYVVHLASSDFQTNVDGTSTVLSSIRKFNKNIDRFVYVSSYEMYPAQDTLSMSTESSRVKATISPGSALYSTALAEQEVISSGVPYNILRASHIYGIRQTVNQLIPSTVNSIVKDFPMKLSGADQVREWTHVNDLSAAIMCVIEKGAKNEVYNVSANAEISNNELVTKIGKILGKEAGIEAVASRPGNDYTAEYRYATDSSKLRAIGWEPQYKFSTSLEYVVNWFKSNRWWLDQTFIS